MLQLVTRFLSFGVNRKFITVLHRSTADSSFVTKCCTCIMQGAFCRELRNPTYFPSSMAAPQFAYRSNRINGESSKIKGKKVGRV